MRTNTRTAASLIGAAAITATGFTGLAATQAHAADAVDMAAVVKAAQWDPAKADQAVTPGAGDSVKKVESKLADKGLLAKKYVDGHFGSTTVTAYAKYQKSLGYSGIAASGLPGKTSLEKLGVGKVTNVIDVGSKKSIDGQTVNSRTAAMLKAAGKKANVDFSITQGSYNAGGVGASAGTHDGGGAVDISVNNIKDKTAAVKALRQVGFAAWERTPAQGFDPHIHAIAVNDTDMAPEAQDQVGDYFTGKNGLASGAADDGPKVKKVTFEEFKRG